MNSTLHTLSALLTVTLYILLTAQTGDSQHVPTRCLCNKAKLRVKGPFSDFEIYLQRPGCPRDEIIVTLKKDSKKVCLSPAGRQGKALMQCWRKMQEEGSPVKKCIEKLRLKKRRSKKKRIQPKKTKS